MENASKALLMAGAIIVILILISMGIYVFTRGSDFVDNSLKELSQAEIEAHNNQFENYEGSVSGAEVKNVCIFIAQLNDKDDYKINVKINVGGLSFPVDEKDEDENRNIYNSILNSIDSVGVYKGVTSYNENGIIDEISFSLVD